MWPFWEGVDTVILKLTPSVEIWDVVPFARWYLNLWDPTHNGSADYMAVSWWCFILSIPTAVPEFAVFFVVFLGVVYIFTLLPLIVLVTLKAVVNLVRPPTGALAVTLSAASRIGRHSERNIPYFPPGTKIPMAAQTPRTVPTGVAYNNGTHKHVRGSGHDGTRLMRLSRGSRSIPA